jgi:hypothetical protein
MWVPSLFPQLCFSQCLALSYGGSLWVAPSRLARHLPPSCTVAPQPSSVSSSPAPGARFSSDRFHEVARVNIIRGQPAYDIRGWPGPWCHSPMQDAACGVSTAERVCPGCVPSLVTHHRRRRVPRWCTSTLRQRSDASLPVLPAAESAVPHNVVLLRCRRATSSRRRPVRKGDLTAR